jgi:hypothetical protein
MAEAKTVPTGASVAAFIAAVTPEDRRHDCRALSALMKKVTGKRPRMWGPSMVGFGSYHYKYASGHEGDCFQIGFSPRKAALTIYAMSGPRRREALLARLGKHTASKSCVYVKRLTDIDLAVLEELLTVTVAHLKGTYGPGAGH